MTTAANIRKRIDRAAAIVAFLTDNPSSISQIAAHLRLGNSSVYYALADLQEDDRVHQGYLGRRHVWLTGPSPEPVKEDKGELVPQRIVRTSYPLHHVRDPLTAALFGEVCHG